MVSMLVQMFLFSSVIYLVIQAFSMNAKLRELVTLLRLLREQRDHEERRSGKPYAF